MKQAIKVVLFGLIAVLLTGCFDDEVTTDKLQQAQQEVITMEAARAIGMPNLPNFREKRMAKMIMELRDRENLSTFAYIIPENTGKPILFCKSIGYPLPYATQYTNPQKMETFVIGGTKYREIIAQADPNGLYMPASAEGTWIMCQDPKNPKNIGALYSESRLTVSPFSLTE